MPKALITGISGFVGHYLTRFLQAKGYEVAGLDRWETVDLAGMAYHSADILDTQALIRIFTAFKPDEVYHLAGVSYLPDADASVSSSLSINIIGTSSVLDATRHGSPKARVLLVGSSKEYNNTISSASISETTLPDPTDFYGISKYCAELLGRQYWHQFGMDVRMSRSFNHTGPGQSPRFVCSDWAKQAASIALGKSEPAITVGDLAAEIDFCDVRDVVAGYHAILDKGSPAEAYNVCSGRVVSLRYVLDYLVAKTGKTVAVKTAKEKMRSFKTSPSLTGNHEKLTMATGWRPEIGFDRTLDDIYGYWVGELGK